MLGTQPSQRQPALFSYHIDLEERLPADHLLRRVASSLDLDFVIPTVRPHYGRSGHVSLDPRVIMKMLLLLFLYNIPSERELVEQIKVRLDFLWFLGLDLDSPVPHHSVLSKARARWGEEVFEQLFVRMVQQCVQAGLVNGSLLHVDSTIVKAQASRDSVVVSSPEMVNALRQAYQEQQVKLEVLPEPKEDARSAEEQSPAAQGGPAHAAASQPEAQSPTLSQAASDSASTLAAAPAAAEPKVRVLARPALPAPETAKPCAKKLPVNQTHISTTDPTAELARNKSGVSELNYKEHRMVDDTHGVITAVAATGSNVPDGSQMPGLYEQHLSTTGLKQARVTVAGDHHYGTADNYIYCEQEGLRAHLGEVSANVEERGKLPLSQFVYEPAQDRLRCPAGHHLVLHQDRPEEQIKVYLIEEAAHCAGCPLRAQCTQSERGRSIRRHVQADLVHRARAQANSPAAKYSRKRRQHVMEGSFADAVNNHGAKKARWRGLGRQRMQSWLIAAVQNLRILLRHQTDGSSRAAVLALVRQFGQTDLRSAGELWAPIWRFADRVRLRLRLGSASEPRTMYYAPASLL